MTFTLVQQTTVEVDGRTWRMFAARFESVDGPFLFHFYAISHEHAAALLNELKASATLVGMVEDQIPK